MVRVNKEPHCPHCGKELCIKPIGYAISSPEKGIPVPPSGFPMNTESHTYNYPALGQFDDVDRI